MVSLAFIISFVASAVALLIGIIIYSDISDDLGSVLNADFTAELVQLLGQNSASGDEPIALDRTNLASVYSGLNNTDIITKITLPISGVVGGGIASTLSQSPMYGCDSPNTNQNPNNLGEIFQVDPITNSEIIGTANLLVLTGTDVTGEDIAGCTTLTHDPVSDLWYAFIRCNDCNGGNDNGRRLAIIDPTTGLGTAFADSGELWQSMAFASNGNLYAVAGAGGNDPNELQIIDTSTGLSTGIVCTMTPNTSDKSWLVFNWNDDTMYRFTGNPPNGLSLPDGLHLERIDDLTTCAKTDITLSGGSNDLGVLAEVLNASFNTDENLFYVFGKTQLPTVNTQIIHTVATSGNTITKLDGNGFKAQGLGKNIIKTQAISGAGYGCSSPSPSTDQQNFIGNVVLSNGIMNSPDVMTVSGLPFTQIGCTGLSQDALTGIYYIISADASGSGTWLSTIDPITGIGTAIGDMGDRYSTMAFYYSDKGTSHLMAMQGQSGANPNGLYEINTSTGSATLKATCTLTNSLNVLASKYGDTTFLDVGGTLFDGFYIFNGETFNQLSMGRISNPLTGCASSGFIDISFNPAIPSGATGSELSSVAWSTEDNLWYLSMSDHARVGFEMTPDWYSMPHTSPTATATELNDLHFDDIMKGFIIPQIDYGQHGTPDDTKGISFTTSGFISSNVPQAFEVGFYTSNNTLIQSHSGSVTVDEAQDLMIDVSPPISIPTDGIVAIGIFGDDINYLGDSTVANFDDPAGGVLATDSPLYACDSTGQGGNEIKLVSKSNGAVSGVSTVTISEGSSGCGGLGQDPTDQQWYISFRSDDTGSNDLATIDPTTGVSTLVGNSGDVLMTMAFDDTGVLYAVSGAGGNIPDELQTWNTSTGALSGSICTFTSSSGSMNTLAFNYDTNTMYRFIGGGNPPNMEAINLTTCADNGNVAMSGITTGYVTIMSVSYNTVDGLFYMSVREDGGGHGGTDLYTLTTGGVATLIGSDIDPNSYWWRGMSFSTFFSGGGVGLSDPFSSDGTDTSSQRTIITVVSSAIGAENLQFAQANGIALTVLGVMPVVLFFALFSILSPRVDGEQ